MELLNKYEESCTISLYRVLIIMEGKLMARAKVAVYESAVYLLER